MREFIDRIRRYNKMRKLPPEMFEGGGPLTKEQKNILVSEILAIPARRDVIESYVQWKYGIYTRAAMRSDDDSETRKFKDRGQGIAEMTYDFQKIWEEMKRVDEPTEKPSKLPFKIFNRVKKKKL